MSSNDWNTIDCPYCASEDSEFVETAGLYRCMDCGEYFEDDVPSIEYAEPQERTRLDQEE